MATTFQALDYFLFVTVLLLSALVGIYYVLKEKWAQKKQTSDDHLMGGREMAVFPVAMSLIASYMSAITVLGIPTEVYVFGAQYWLVGLSGLMTYPVTCHIFLPFFHKLQLNSAYQYLELRFNRATRYIASAIFSIEMILYMAVVLYAPSLALNQVTGLSLWGSCFISVTGLSLWGSILSVGIVVTFYTALGGLRAVLWTDTFQTMVVVAGLIGIIALGSSHVGGMAKVWSIAEQGGRINFWNMDPFVRVTFWGLTIGSFIGQLTIYGANQTMLQRYMSISNVKKSQLALYVSLPVTMLMVFLVCIAGLVIYAAYTDCDPYLDGKLIARDQILPYYVMETLGKIPGVPGLFVACIFSAALSSISSCLNALTITMLEDLIKPTLSHNKYTIQADTEARLAKLLGIAGGVIVIIFAFISAVMGTTVLQIMISVLGMAGGPLLGLFLMGMFLPCVNAKGALSGLVTSTILIFWIVLGAYILHAPLPELPFKTSGCTDNVVSGYGEYKLNTVDISFPDSTIELPGMKYDDKTDWSGFNKIYTLSFLWYPTFAVGVCLVVGIFTSWITDDLTLDALVYSINSTYEYFMVFATVVDQLASILAMQEFSNTSHTCYYGWRKEKINPQYIYPVSRSLIGLVPGVVRQFLQCDTWWSFNVRSVDSAYSDSEEEGDMVAIKLIGKGQKPSVKLNPKYCDRPDEFDLAMDHTDL